MVQRPQLHPCRRDGSGQDDSVIDVRGRGLQVRDPRAVLDHSTVVDYSELAAGVRELDRYECRGVSRVVSIIYVYLYLLITFLRSPPSHHFRRTMGQNKKSRVS